MRCYQVVKSNTWENKKTWFLDGVNGLIEESLYFFNALSVHFILGYKTILFFFLYKINKTSLLLHFYITFRQNYNCNCKLIFAQK